MVQRNRVYPCVSETVSGRPDIRQALARSPSPCHRGHRRSAWGAGSGRTRAPIIRMPAASETTGDRLTVAAIGRTFRVWRQSVPASRLRAAAAVHRVSAPTESWTNSKEPGNRDPSDSMIPDACGSVRMPAVRVFGSPFGGWVRSRSRTAVGGFSPAAPIYQPTYIYGRLHLPERATVVASATFRITKDWPVVNW